MAPKKSRTGLIVGLSLCGGLFLLVIIIGAIGAATGSDSETKTAAKPTTTAVAGAVADSGASTTTAAATTDAAASGTTCKGTPFGEKIDTKGNGLYAGRPDAQDEDHEAVVGDCVRLQGYTAYVTGAMVESSLGDLESSLGEYGGNPITVISVTIENRDSEAKPYNLFDWQLQTPSGQVINPTLYLGDDDLGSGSLIQGGTVTGKIAFDAPAGSYFAIFKPGAFDSARGVWQVTS